MAAHWQRSYPPQTPQAFHVRTWATTWNHVAPETNRRPCLTAAGLMPPSRHCNKSRHTISSPYHHNTISSQHHDDTTTTPTTTPNEATIMRDHEQLLGDSCNDDPTAPE
ncbi:hypothetical protein EI94DRAFT_1730952 [Lactarius quietus]|nr:hypothetical protein EI94DRAFT_1730952 [Lactarius quietus]